MRLIKTENSFDDDWIPCLTSHHGQPYAILSHCWLAEANDEVLSTDIEEIGRKTTQGVSSPSETIIRNPHYIGTSPINKLGFAKLKGAAQQANKDAYDYIWVDTCCINKDSSSELSEAINSMWSWYKEARICYVYLVDVDYEESYRTRQFSETVGGPEVGRYRSF